MNRRKFIQVTSAGLISSALFGKSFGKFSNDESKVIVWETEGNGIESIRKLFDAFGGLKTLIKGEISKSTILIKPNLYTLPVPVQNASTTSLEVIESLIAYLSENNVKKIIVTDHTMQEQKDYSDIELNKIINKYNNATLVLANEKRWYETIDVPGKVLLQTDISKMIQRADLLINLPTAKHHSGTKYSGAIKNLMGLVWDRIVFHTKMDLHRAIADLSLVIKPGLNIVDATKVLLTGGPTGPGNILNDNKLFASFDMLAVDSVVASRYNFGGKSNNPKEIAHLKYSYENNIGEIELDKINIIRL